MSGTRMRPNANPVLDLMRDDDMEDAWGTAMSWAWAVAEVLHAVDEHVPSGLGYRPSIAGSEAGPECEDFATQQVWDLLHRTPGAWVDPEFGASVEDLQFAARCLSRYLDWLSAAGRSY